MPWWYYKGKTTTPVDLPGSGPTIIKPRMRFEAPLSAVAHLKRIGMVAICEPPKTQGKAVQPPKEDPAKKSDMVGIKKEVDGGALGLSAVVASETSEPEARVEVGERAGDVAVEAEADLKEEEKEKKERRRR